MKKSAITLTTMALFFAASSFTTKNREDVPERVKSAFQKDFTTALNVSWEKNDNLYFANFNWNASDVKAAFNADGDLLSTSRKISIAQLPLKITLAIEKKYKGYRLEDNAMEIISDDETTYHFAVKNDAKELNLISNANGDISESK